MNLILKAINKEKSKIRQFAVSFSKEPAFAVIYEYLPEYDTFLPSLVEGIKSLTCDTIDIYCSENEMFSEIEKVMKLKYTDESIEVMEQKNTLTEPSNEVK